jgi:hypothetical protein
MHGCDEAVAATGKGLDESRVIGRIAERVAECLDGGIQALIEVDVRSVGPQAGAQVFTTDYFAGMFQQGGENLQRLVAETNREASTEKFSLGKIQLKLTEAQAGSAIRRGFHGFGTPRRYDVARSVSPIGRPTPAIFAQKNRQVCATKRVANSDRFRRNSG